MTSKQVGRAIQRLKRPRPMRRFIITEQASYEVKARCAGEALAKYLNAKDPNKYFKECTDRQVWAL